MTSVGYPRQRKRRNQRIPPELMRRRGFNMPPSLYDAVVAKAKELGYTSHALARIYLMRGLMDAGEPPGEWWYKQEPVEPEADGQFTITLKLPPSMWADIEKFRRQHGFQTLRLAIDQLLILGIRLGDNRGTGVGGRY